MIRYAIVHPTTGDRAYATTLAGAETAVRTLREDAAASGVQPHVRPNVVVLPVPCELEEVRY